MGRYVGASRVFQRGDEKVRCVKNAAALLADVFESWTIPQGHSAAGHRASVAKNKGIALWPLHRLVMGYLMQIEKDLDALESTGDDVQHFRETLPAWYAAVFSVEAAWRDAVADRHEIVNPLELRLLRALASQIDLLRMAPVVPASQLADIRTALMDARDLIISAGENVLSAEARRYLLGLVFEADKVIEEIEVVGTAALRTITFELGGAMASVAELVKDPQEKKTWWAKTRGVLAQWSAVVPIAAIEAGVDATIQRAIGS